MLQKAPDDGRDRDILADSGHAGAQAADAAHLQTDAHSCHGCAVQGADNFPVHQLIAFEKAVSQQNVDSYL